MERHAVLAGALNLLEFTVQELAAFTHVNVHTVRTVLRRDTNFFESLGREETGRQGGKPERFRLRPSRMAALRRELHALVARIPTGVIETPDGVDASLDGPPTLRYVEDIMGRRFDAADSDAARERLLTLARASLPGARRDVEHVMASRRRSAESNALKERLERIAARCRPDTPAVAPAEPVQWSPFTSSPSISTGAHVPDDRALVLFDSSVLVDPTPRTPLETAVATIWNKVLGQPSPDLDADFFESGGSSLAAVSLISDLRDASLGDLPVSEFFANPTIAGISAKLADERSRAVHAGPHNQRESGTASTGDVTTVLDAARNFVAMAARTCKPAFPMSSVLGALSSTWDLIEQRMHAEAKVTTMLQVALQRPEPERVTTLLRACFDVEHGFAIRDVISTAISFIEAQSDRSFEEALTWTALRCGADPAFPLYVLKRRRPSATGARARYEIANLCELAGREGEAFEHWMRWRQRDHARQARTGKLPFVVIKIARAYVGSLLDQLDTTLGRPLVSVAAHAPVEELRTSPDLFPSTMPASAADPIDLSLSLRQQQPTLHVYGPLGARLSTPGMTRVRLATGLATLGVPEPAAWQCAALEDRQAVVVAEGRAHWTEEDRAQVEHMLTHYREAMLVAMNE